MRRDPEKLLARVARWWFRRREVRADSFSLSEFRNLLQIEWRAHDVHPWDRDLSQTCVTELFAKQCLDDTGATIERLFCELPEIAFIDFKVIDPKSSALILYRSVDRNEAIRRMMCHEG